MLYSGDTKDYIEGYIIGWNSGGHIAGHYSNGIPSDSPFDMGIEDGKWDRNENEHGSTCVPLVDLDAKRFADEYPIGVVISYVDPLSMYVLGYIEDLPREASWQTTGVSFAKADRVWTQYRE